MVLYHTHHTKTIISLFAHVYKPGILCACRPGLTGWPRPINIPGYLYPTSHLVWQQNRGAWSPPRTRLTIACITSLSPWVHIQNTTEVNGELVNRAVVDQPAATSIWPSKGGDNWLLSSRYRGSPVWRYLVAIDIYRIWCGRPLYSHIIITDSLMAFDPRVL